MDFNFKTIHEFNDYFKDEKTCYEFLEQQRWEGGKPVCPHCGVDKKPYKVKPRGKFKDIPSYRCSDRDCDLPFTVRTGSIFEGSRVELRKWFHAIYEITTAKKGISSLELGQRIGTSQKTAWFINHRLRVMLKETNPALLSNMVEADETLVGGKIKNKHVSKRKKLAHTNSHTHKTVVFGALERGGKLRTQVLPNEKKDTILPVLKGYITADTTIYTDSLFIYRSLREDYIHKFVNHEKKEYVRGDVHTNSIEGFWSLLKKGLIGTFHQVSPQHLQKYCDEFSFRYNSRKGSNNDRFNASIKNFDTERLTYKELTSIRYKEKTE